MSYYQRKAQGYQQLTVAGTAVGLTMPTGAIDTGPNSATVVTKKNVSFVFIRCSTANVRWRDDGTDPDASTGVPLNAGETLEYDGNPARIKFIRTGGTSAVLDVSFYG